MIAAPVAIALALVAAAPAVPSVTIVDPATTLPNLVRALRWASLAAPELSPRRLRQSGRMVGFDVFDVTTYAGVGLDAKPKLLLWLPAAASAGVLELRVKKPRIADAAVLAVLKSKPRAQRIRASPGFVMGATAPTGVAALRKGKRLFLQVGARSGGVGDSRNPLTILARLAGRKPAKKPPPPQGAAELAEARLAPTRRAMSARRVAKPPAIAKKRPGVDLWFRSPRHSAEAAVWFEDAGLSARARAPLAAAAQFVAAEMVRNTARSRALLDGARLGAVAQVTFHLHGPGVRAFARRALRAPQAAALFNGEAHAVLTKGGAVVVAAVMKKRANRDEAAVMIAVAESARPGLRTLLVEGARGEHLVVAWLGRINPRDVRSAVLHKRSSARHAPFHAQVTPPALLPALQRQPNVSQTLGLRQSHLVMMQLMVQPILAATQAVELSMRVSGSRVEADVELVY